MLLLDHSLLSLKIISVLLKFTPSYYATSYNSFMLSSTDNSHPLAFAHPIIFHMISTSTSTIHQFNILISSELVCTILTVSHRHTPNLFFTVKYSTSDIQNYLLPQWNFLFLDLSIFYPSVLSLFSFSSYHWFVLGVFSLSSLSVHTQIY